MLGFTTGEWTMAMPSEKGCKEDRERITIRSEGIHIATVFTGGMAFRPSPTAIANAKLIVAAPLLYAAAENAASMIDSKLYVGCTVSRDRDVNVLSALRQAIERARNGAF